MSYRREVRLLLFLLAFLSAAVGSRWWFWLGPGRSSIAWASAPVASAPVTPSAEGEIPSSPPPNPPVAPSGKSTDTDSKCLDVNLATQPQLEELPGIGPVIAAAIIAERERLGGFPSLQALLDVKGIGKVRFGRISPLLCEIKAEKES